MAYKYFANRYFATAQERHDAQVSLLLDAGWTQHDQVAGQYTIVKSDGDAADGKYVYLKIPMTDSSWLFYVNWNTGTHTNVGGSLQMGTHSTGGTVRDFFYADKNGVYSTQSTGGAASITKILIVKAQNTPAGSFTTQLTSGISAGSNVVISVADNSNFKIGAYYAALDVVNGKRQAFKVTAKGTGTITAGTIDTALASGTLVGVNTYPVFVYAGGYLYPVAAHHAAYPGGTTLSYGTSSNSALSPFVSSFQSIAFLDPRAGVGSDERRLWPAQLLEAVFTGNARFCNTMGTLDLIKCAPAQSTTTDYSCAYTLNDGDVQAVTQRDSGTSSGSNTATVFNDTTKNWTTDQWAGKVLVTTSGVEAGQIAKIISNTATALTVSTMSVIPSTCTYVIADEAYRVFAGLSGSSYEQYFLKEGV